MVEVKKLNDTNLNFNFHAFGEKLKLVLQRNSQLTIPQAEVVRRHNGRTVSRKNLRSYYTGYLHGKPGSSLAVEVNNGSLVCIAVPRNVFKIMKIMIVLFQCP